MTDVAEIARSLTKAQRAFAMGDHARFARGYKPGERLVDLGLIARERGTFGDRMTWTERGLAVRDYLKEQG